MEDNFACESEAYQEEENGPQDSSAASCEAHWCMMLREGDLDVGLPT